MPKSRGKNHELKKGAPIKIINKMTKTRYGRMLYKQYDKYIGRSLFLYGEWSQTECGFLRTYLQPVPAITVDAFHLKKLDFIKMDIEGYEYPVLRGAEHTIQTHRPFIYMECHKGAGERAVQFLLDRYYDIYLHQATSFNKDNFKGCSKDIFDGFIESNVFCSPRERNLEVPLNKVVI